MDDLPHFLLLLLVLQRFDDAKWGYVTGCPESQLKVIPERDVSTASFFSQDGTTVFFHHADDRIYMGITLLGRGTSVTGGREEQRPTAAELGNAAKLRAENDLAVKIYWPEESRVSEVEMLKRAREYGVTIDFIGDHIPEMVCHGDPDFLCGSTKTVRQFLGLATNGSRRLRVIVFRRLRSIRELKEQDMPTAYLQAFFCKYDE